MHRFLLAPNVCKSKSVHVHLSCIIYVWISGDSVRASPGCLGYGEPSLVMFAWVEVSMWRERAPLQENFPGVPWNGWERWCGVGPMGTQWPDSASSEKRITNRVWVLHARKNATNSFEPRSITRVKDLYVV